MKKVLAIVALLALSWATQGRWLARDALAAEAAPVAGSSCEAQAVGKDGKKLAGAAKTSFMKKCEADAGKVSCEDKAVGKDGKKLAGAAKTSFMKKCEADSKAAAK